MRFEWVFGDDDDGWGQIKANTSIFDLRFQVRGLEPETKKEADIRRERSHNAKTISVTPPIPGPVSAGSKKRTIHKPEGKDESHFSLKSKEI